MGKKLHVAFVWHMHQPIYKDQLTGEYYMPWVRLHAIKDYLDMLLILKKFPDIRQTFNFVPSLLDQLDDYGHHEAHDRNSLLLIKSENEFSSKDKVYILERCFDANYHNMIIHNEYYHHLFQRSRAKNVIDILDSFTAQEYADILMWFNLVWFDPLWYKEIPELKEFQKQAKGFTLDQRKRILELQRELIRKIIPTYKEYQDNGQIEVTTTPYYHPILPLLIDNESSKIARPDLPLPKRKFAHPEDAVYQVKKAVDKYQEIFGRPLRGMWPSEQSVSPLTMNLLADHGIQWAISDEGVLASSIGKEFHRNFHGNMEDPSTLCQAYEVKTSTNPVQMVFRNVTYSDLIGFHYGKMNPSEAAWDLFCRIKDVQKKLEHSNVENILTIALDGENCWENYNKDGYPFLTNLYNLLSEDDNIEVCTVSEFLEKNPPTESVDIIHSGSWINRDFHIWIGDPAKNVGWTLLKKTRDDLVHFLSVNDYSDEQVEKAWEEIYIAEGSDWFWWYGEPNFSSQDELFDEQFRLHLQNVYRILNEAVPAELLLPVEVILGRSVKHNYAHLIPYITGTEKEQVEEWLDASAIVMAPGAMYQSDQILRRILFCFDKDQLKIRLDTAKSIIKNKYEVYLYAYNPGKGRYNSPVRIRTSAGHSLPETLKYGYAYELNVKVHGDHSKTTISEAIEHNLWHLKENTQATVTLNGGVQLYIPFSELQVESGEEIHFVVAVAESQVLKEIAPKENAIAVSRP